MRAVSAVALLVVAVSVGACAAAVRSPLARSGPVVISASCTADGVQASITPWVVEVGKGRDVEWAIDQGSAIDVIDIVEINNWPFTYGPPRATKGTPGKGRQMKGNVNVGDRYHYGISFVCPDGRRVMIDPDMIIVNAE